MIPVCVNCGDDTVLEQMGIRATAILYPGESVPRLVAWDKTQHHHYECSNCGHRWQDSEVSE
jgi:ribosomal protein S27AE